MTYTSLLGLLDIAGVWKRYHRLILILAAVLVVYAFLHLTGVATPIEYLESLGFYCILLISGLAIHHYISQKEVLSVDVFKWMVPASLGLLLIGLFAFITPWSEVFWTDHKFISEGALLTRYRGLGHEPSHYALVMSPVIFYFFWKVVLTRNFMALLYLLGSTLPVFFTLSFGFFAGASVAVVLTLLYVLFRYGRFEKLLIVPAAIGIVISVFVMLFPNPVSNRVNQILEGKDTSVNGRTTEAFMLAHRCAEKGNVFYGVGLGQISRVGEEVIRPYYQALDSEGYSKESWPVLRIPNSLAETLAIFGYSGLLLKLGFIFYCFVHFKVYDNYFNLSVFIFLLIYQAMGSFIFSSTEVAMWAMAFSKVFGDFDVLKPNRKWH